MMDDVGAQNMNRELEELSGRIAALQDDELLGMVAHASEYRPDALQMAMDELQRRGISFSLPSPPSPSHPQDSRALSRKLANVISWPVRRLKAMDRDRAKKFLRTATIIMGVMWVPSLMFAGLSGMMFDAPGSDKNPLLCLLFFSFLAFPVLCVASVILSWLLFARGRHTAACYIAVIPAVHAAPFLIVVALCPPVLIVEVAGFTVYRFLQFLRRRK